MTTLVTTKGQIVIPSKIRRKFNIKKGTRLFVEERDNEIVLIPITADYIKCLPGILKSEGRLTKELLEERARDREMEESKWQLKS